MRWMLLLLCCLQNISYANVAVDELNAQLAKKEQLKTKAPNVSKQLQDLSQHYYFIFIYRGTCPHCHQFSPVLKDFVDTFHVDMKAYSIDNMPLDGFKGQPLTPELFQTLYASGGYKPIVPALFLINRDTLEAYPVLFGEASPYQLARRMNELMQHIEGRFND